MTVFSREPAGEPTYVQGPPSGFGWIAHPEESGRRTSHAVVGPDGVWLLDPLAAEGVEERLDDPVAGVIVCSNYHVRDADRFARRYGVPVTVPPWLDRAAGRLDARVRRAETAADGTIRLHRLSPIPGWEEALAVTDGTVYVADALSRRFAVGAEVVGLVLPFRLAPPREAFADCSAGESGGPARLLTGHGPGVHEAAAQALRTALTAPWRRLPWALIGHGPETVWGVIAAATE